MMIGKVAKGAFATAVLGGLIFGKDLFSYTRAGVMSARDKIRAEVPIEFEIERARRDVERLLPEVRRSMHVIAEEQVAVAQLKEGINRREESLAKQEEAILSLTADLKQKDSKLIYAGRRYQPHEVEKDLAERFNRYKIAEDTVKREQQLLSAKEAALKANRDTLEGMLSQKKDLEVQLERLEARLRTIAARKQIQGLEIDDSHLSRVKALIAKIENRLDVEDAVLAADGELSGLIPVEREEATDTKDVTHQVEAYFGNRLSPAVVAH
ncbi:hypothetical protein [Planctomicrobium sp. SH664]|uniref:hypothetical protein n=1 Tax=Planctomicrobium sp. SH664 TaxID=3448125 RepID=UPI003F5C81EF